MLHLRRISLSTLIEVDLDWSGHAQVTRTITLDPLVWGAIPVADTAITYRLPTRDILDVTVSDGVGGAPDKEVITVPEGTALTVWPGIPELIDRQEYKIIVKYRQIECASHFPGLALVYGTDEISAGPANGTELSSRQYFCYRMLLPRRGFVLGLFANVLNDVKLLHSDAEVSYVDHRPRLEWSWSAESGERGKRIRYHYEEYRRANLRAILTWITTNVLTLITGAIAVAVKPELASFIVDHILNPVT